MKHLIIITTVLVSGLLSAQSNYEKGMKQAFELWGKNQPLEASNLFERIANAEQDNWLPPYYAAQVIVIKSFGEKDKDVLTGQLNKAQDLINYATAISKNNADILVLQAMLHTAWVAFDGATYGPTLSGKVASIYAQAEQIAPENPMVVLSKAEWGIGGARFFGQDITPFCKDVERAMELFANFKPVTEFHPNWGQDRAEQILASCKE